MPRRALGALLRQHRKDAHLTQKALAELLNYSYSLVSRVEKGERTPTRDYLDQVIACLHLPPEKAQALLTHYQHLLGQDAIPLKDRRVDWGDAPDVSHFYGRTTEQEVLARWLVADRCRLVGVAGIGGVGKTALTIKVAQAVQAQFDCLIWYSLREAPPLSTLLEHCLQTLLDSADTPPPQSVSTQLKQLIQRLAEKRCLLVLDNFEAVLSDQGHFGGYQPGLENYSDLLYQVGQASHQSCLVYTSREIATQPPLLTGESRPVRILSIQGLDPQAGQQLLQEQALVGQPDLWQQLIDHYSGNPLALSVIAKTIRNLYHGDIAAFLQENTFVFGQIHQVLHEQFVRLSRPAQVLMVWLAIEREPVSQAQLRANLVIPMPNRVLLESLQALQSRSLIEASEGPTGVHFTLQNVVMEFTTAWLISQICAEIKAGEPNWFNSHALSLAYSKAYIRAGQNQVIISPILRQLGQTDSQSALAEQLMACLARWRQTYGTRPGYLAANIIHLLIELGLNLRGYDFSGVAIRQAFLQNVSLAEVNLRGADLHKTIFTERYGVLLSFDFSPDGNLIALTNSNGKVMVLQADTLEPIETYNGHQAWIWGVAFSPNGQLIVSGSSDKTVRVWERETGRCCYILRDHTRQVFSVAFSPDGQRFASGSADYTIRIWQSDTGHCQQVLNGHTDRIWSVAFSPDGQLLASVSDDGTVHLWETATWRCLHILRGHQGWIKTVAFSRDGQFLASGGDDRLVRVWHIASQKQVQTLAGHTERIRRLVFHPNGQTLISGSDDHTVRFWDYRAGRPTRILTHHTNQLRALALSADGKRLISGGEDHSYRLWHGETGQLLQTRNGHFPRYWVGLAFNHDGNLLAACSEDRVIWLWETKTGRIRHTLSGHTQAVRAIACHPKLDIVASGGVDLTIRLWNMHTGECIHMLEGHTVWIDTLAFNSDGSRLISGSMDRTMRLWDTRTGQCLRVYPAQENSILSVAFSPDDQHIASCCDSNPVRLWSVETGHLCHTFPAETTQTIGLAYHPRGTHLATADLDQSVRIWDVAQGKLLQTFLGHIQRTASVAFSPDSHLLASSNQDCTVRLWDVEKGRSIHFLSGHTGGVQALAFHPRQPLLATGSTDETIKLWDTNTGEYLQTLQLDRPYEQMNITDVTGLSEAQQFELQILGAIEKNR